MPILAYISPVIPHLEYAYATWDPYTSRDSQQLAKVQRRAVRFVRRDYRYTTSASQLITKLGRQSLSEHRKNSRPTLLYKVWRQCHERKTYFKK